MKIVRVRFSHCVMAFDDDRAPIMHHFHNADLGLTLEVRGVENHMFIYGWVERSGITTHAGQHGGYWVHSPCEHSYYVASELFRIAKDLGVEAHHIWPFVDQLPLFTATGVDVADALALAGPIKDLLAKGARPNEVMDSFNIDKAVIEFVLGTKLPPSRDLDMTTAQRDNSDDIASIW